MMIVGEVITQWVGSGVEGDSFRPSVSHNFTLKSWEDVTHQLHPNIPPENNMYVVEIVADRDVFTQIENDSDYFVLWSEEVVNGEQI